MSYHLCIETNLKGYGFLSLYKGHEKIYLNSWPEQKFQFEVVTEILDQAFKETKLNLSNITKIGVNKGPGSFTGIRLGLNIAKSLNYSHQIPIYPISSFDIVAQSFITQSELEPEHLQQSTEFIVLFNAHHNQFFAKTYKYSLKNQSWETYQYPYSIDSSEFKELESASENLTLVTTDLVIKDIYRNSIIASPMAFVESFNRLLVNPSNSCKIKKEEWKSVAPLYIRKSFAEELLAKKK